MEKRRNNTAHRLCGHLFVAVLRTELPRGEEGGCGGARRGSVSYWGGGVEDGGMVRRVLEQGAVQG